MGFDGMLAKGVAILAASIALSGAAFADQLSFGISGFGTFSVNTGNIAANTTTKTIASTELVSAISTPTTAADSDIAIFSTALDFSTDTLNTYVGADDFSVTAGDLTFSFTQVVSALLVATGENTNGSLSEQFDGTVTGDTGSDPLLLGQTVSLSETCTQEGLDGTITCSDSLATPGVQSQQSAPEPASLALFGSGLLGLGLARRRRRMGKA